MTEQNDRREAAVKRLRAKRGFKIHVAIYLVVNALIVVVWASSGAAYFWPIWAMLGWESRTKPTADKAQLILAHVLKRQLIWRLAEVFAEVLDSANVSGLCQGRHVAKAHVVDHALT